MSADCGDVVVATDPFTDDDTTGRPFLVINRAAMPSTANNTSLSR